MKTIIQVVQHLSPGGIEVMALELKKVAPSNSRMLIISLEGHHRDTINTWPRLGSVADDIICLGKKPGFDWNIIQRLIEIIKSLDVVAIHTHHIGPLIYGGLAARLAGVKRLVHTEHDAWHLENTKRRWLQRSLLKLTSPTLIADSTMVAKGMKSFLGSEDVQVIRNGIDVNRFRPGGRIAARENLGIASGKIWVGSSGRLEAVKGHSVLIEALSHLPDYVHLALAGSGSLERALRIQARTLNLEHRIKFLGHIDNMPLFYKALDVFCLPSLKEGMPLAPLEAQACCIPVVMSDTGGTAEAICQDSGRLVPPGKPKPLADALLAVLCRESPVDPRSFVKDSANLITMAEAYVRLYEPQVKVI